METEELGDKIIMETVELGDKIFFLLSDSGAPELLGAPLPEKLKWKQADKLANAGYKCCRRWWNAVDIGVPESEVGGLG